MVSRYLSRDWLLNSSSETRSTCYAEHWKGGSVGSDLALVFEREREREREIGLRIARIFQKLSKSCTNGRAAARTLFAHVCDLFLGRSQRTSPGVTFPLVVKPFERDDYKSMKISPGFIRKSARDLRSTLLIATFLTPLLRSW